MALVSRAEYEERSWDLAWMLAYKAPIAMLAALALAAIGVSAWEPIIGVGFALLTPLGVMAAGHSAGQYTSRGYPSASVAVASQFAFLFMLLVALR